MVVVERGKGGEARRRQEAFLSLTAHHEAGPSSIIMPYTQPPPPAAWASIPCSVSCCTKKERMDASGSLSRHTSPHTHPLPPLIITLPPT